MSEIRNGVRTIVLGAGLLAGWGAAHGQLQGSARPTWNTPQGGLDDKDDPRNAKIPAEIRERMEKARNDERQKRLQSDTEKLLALATSLKIDVDKTDKYTLSLDVIRRTEEIEKLARSIRERMKQ